MKPQIDADEHRSETGRPAGIGSLQESAFIRVHLRFHSPPHHFLP
ncbi:MAG TPA: hypothetical protein PK322_08895 [Opitutaceae bacterium]|nr:hypothetical protein [Opitutaceae bacterium]